MMETQQPVRTSAEYERALEALRRMLDIAIVQARHGAAQPVNGEALKRRLRERLARRKRGE